MNLNDRIIYSQLDTLFLLTTTDFALVATFVVYAAVFLH